MANALKFSGLALLLWALQSSAITPQTRQALPDPTRSYLNKLKMRSSIKVAEFEYPFLLSATALVVEKTPLDTAALVRNFLSRGKLPFPGHFPKQEMNNVDLELPGLVKTGSQGEGIKECTAEKCLMKLHTEREKKVVEKAPLDGKVAAYQKLVSQRLASFVNKRELLGYEDRTDNREYVKKIIEMFPFFSKRYPELGAFFAEGFWKGGPNPSNLAATGLRQEIVVIAPERMQPIWRLGEAFEFTEGAGWVFVELHFYSNHYMDSSIRILEVLPHEKKSIFVLTDIMEIDELTKSSFIRTLYRGKMEDAVSTAQDQDLRKMFPSTT